MTTSSPEPTSGVPFAHYKVVFEDGIIDHFLVEIGVAGGQRVARIEAIRRASAKHPLKSIRSLEFVRTCQQEPHQPAH